jgi:hypothetical protein
MPKGIARALLILAVVLPTSCSSHATRHEVLNDQEYGPYRLPGTAAIEGQVVSRLTPGEVQYCPHCQIRLRPVTTETTKYVERVVLAGKTELMEDRPGQVKWLSAADEVGRFRFVNLPVGDYYLFVRMAWRQEGKTHDGMGFARAHVEAGQTVQVDVTPVTTPSGG